jgi:hypothetical protein
MRAAFIHGLPRRGLLGIRIYRQKGCAWSEWPLRLPVIDQPPIFDNLAFCEAREDHRRPSSMLAGGLVSTTQGQSYGHHIPFGHHRLDVGSEVGEELVHPREDALGVLGTVRAFMPRGVGMVLAGEQLVDHRQLLVVYELFDDTPHKGFVLMCL